LFNPTKITRLWVALLLFGVFYGSPPVHAQLNISSSSSGTVALRICNEGKLDIDVFVSQAGKMFNSHVSAATCATVSEGTEPAYVGFAFADSRGQWGAARRLDLFPDFGHNVLVPVNRNETVSHGNANLTLPMLLSFRPRSPECRPSGGYSEAANLPFNATVSQRAVAQIADTNRAHRDSADTTCETLDYILYAKAFPNTREVSFRDANARAPERAQRMNWSDLLPAMRKIARSQKLWDVIPRYIVIRGTVSSIEERDDSVEPGVRWVDIAFRESPAIDTGPNRRPYSEFNVCTSKPDVFETLFGADFRTSMIGKTIEVEGEIAPGNECRGLRASIRVTLARQVRLVPSAQFEPGRVPRFAPVTPEPRKLAAEQIEAELVRQEIEVELARKRVQHMQEDSRK
jgi:hypothetical protein